MFLLYSVIFLLEAFVWYSFTSAIQEVLYAKPNKNIFNKFIKIPRLVGTQKMAPKYENGLYALEIENLNSHAIQNMRISVHRNKYHMVDSWIFQRLLAVSVLKLVALYKYTYIYIYKWKLNVYNKTLNNTLPKMFRFRTWFIPDLKALYAQLFLRAWGHTLSRASVYHYLTKMFSTLRVRLGTCGGLGSNPAEIRFVPSWGLAIWSNAQRFKIQDVKHTLYDAWKFH